jgi:hypothetical protein
VLWILLANVSGHEVVLDNFSAKYLCMQAASPDAVAERSPQIDYQNVKCWPFIKAKNADTYFDAEE